MASTSWTSRPGQPCAPSSAAASAPSPKCCSTRPRGRPSRGRTDTCVGPTATWRRRTASSGGRRGGGGGRRGGRLLHVVTALGVTRRLRRRLRDGRAAAVRHRRSVRPRRRPSVRHGVGRRRHRLRPGGVGRGDDLRPPSRPPLRPARRFDAQLGDGGLDGADGHVAAQHQVLRVLLQVELREALRQPRRCAPHRPPHPQPPHPPSGTRCWLWGRAERPPRGGAAAARRAAGRPRSRTSGAAAEEGEGGAQ